MITVIDDDESILDSTRQLLRSAGYGVSTFDSAQSFLDSGQIKKSKCIILDVKMHGIDGLQLQRHLKDSGAGVPIVFLSAHDDAGTRRRAVEGGAVDFLSKPFDAGRLLSTVEMALSFGSNVSMGRVVYLGRDDCYRVMILTKAGYAVQQCSSLAELVRSFESGVLADLICIAEGHEPYSAEALSLARTKYITPMILFRNTGWIYNGFKFDLEIESLAPPGEWLGEIERILRPRDN